MRLIPGKTKVEIELFKGVTLTDIIIGLVSAILLIFVLTSTIPGKVYIIFGLILLTAGLLVRLDSEPNYVFLMHIFRHFALKRKFARASDDSAYVNRTNGEVKETVAAAPAETSAERKARLKAERAERKADDKILKSKTSTKEEQDAIWLKRANQSAARKQAKNSVKKIKVNPMKEIIPFTGIKDDFIEYGGEYYGAVIEVPPVEFRFFSPTRRTNSIDGAFGRVLRSISINHAANIVKLERPVIYDEYIQNESRKVNDIRSSYENGFLTEEEFKARVEVLCDRITDLQDICYDNKVIQPYYYIVLYDSDKNQLTNTVNSALDMLRNGEMNVKRLNSKELAVFLKYSNTLDFDERDVEYVAPEKYAEWAMPDSVAIKHRTVTTNGILCHNFRITAYPSEVDDAWLASVMSIPATKVMVKCKPMDREKAVRGIDRSLQELRSMFMATGIDSRRIELQEHIDTLSSLLSMLKGDNESLLEVNVFITAYDVPGTAASLGKKIEEIRTSLPVITNMKRTVRRIYSESGMRLNGMDFDQVNAFIGSQVSAWDPLYKKGRGMPSNSVAGCYPWVFAHISDKNGIKLGTSEGVPVFIDFFRRDSERVNSNMVIVGKSGSGKSYATKSLLVNLAADDSKIFILDPENEYTELAANLHGKFINVGNAQYGRLNPFHIITALDDDESDGSTVSGSYSTHLQFLEEFFRQIIPDCDKDAMEYLNSIIDRMYTNMGISAETDLSKLGPEDYPTFDDLYDAILSEFQSTDNEYIRTMLRTLMNYVAKFSSGGRNANIWNGPSTVTTDENFTVFNFQSLLANRNGAIANAQMLLVLKYIDNEIIKNRDYNTRHKLNRKVVVVIDEAHVFIDTKFPVALDFMFQLAKRIRKYNGMQIVITQNIKDFVGSEEIARKSTAIINACQYSFIFSLSPNDMGDLCKLYEKAGGINESEQEQIISAPRGQAFTVMSPQSRSTFKVVVPNDVVAMFKDPDFETRYFAGEEGEKEWNELLGESRAIHEANVQKTLEAKKKASESKKKASGSDGGNVTFIEISEEELKAEKKASSARNVSYDDDDIPGIPDDPEEFAAMKASRRNAAVSQTVPAQGGTEKMLGELLEKFSYDSMLREIRRSVREELDKLPGAGNIGTSGITTETAYASSSDIGRAVSADESAEENEDDKLFENFDFNFDPDTEAALNAEETEETEEAPVTADEETDSEASSASTEETQPELPPLITEPESGSDDGEDFDILKMLSMEAESIKNVSPIDLMVEYGEEILEISLDELIRYNSVHG